MGKEYIYSFLCSMYLLGLQIFFFNSVEGEIVIPWENITTNATSQHIGGRVKRSEIRKKALFLHLRIKYEDGEEVMMHWTKVKSYVANKHLPVFVSSTNEKLDVMQNVGKFVSYYDVQHCSAVVYFEKSNSFYGVIGTDYYIENLPFNFDSGGHYRSPVVGYPYIKKRQSQLSHIHPNSFVPPMYRTNSESDIQDLINTLYENDNIQLGGDVSINLLDTQNHTDNTKPVSRNYVLETLIFVARGVADDFFRQFGPDHYVEWIVKYYLIYFHAIDMIFKGINASGGHIRMNIAKICIETHTRPFNFLSHDRVQYDDIIRELPIHLSTFKEDYPEDSFEYVFIQTSRPIWLGAVGRSGITKRSSDLTQARRHHQFYNAVPVTIMSYGCLHADYITTVHAIGGILNMNVDPEHRGSTAAGQCSSVMQNGGPRCSRCLRWSEDSKNELDVFFRTNENRCFLLNYPRSLIRFGRGHLYSPLLQCECYGYDYYKKLSNGGYARVIPASSCVDSLKCEQHDRTPTVFKTIGMRPFDGTPCGNGKVCCNKECVLL